MFIGSCYFITLVGICMFDQDYRKVPLCIELAVYVSIYGVVCTLGTRIGIDYGTLFLSINLNPCFHILQLAILEGNSNASVGMSPRFNSIFVDHGMSTTLTPNPTTTSTLTPYTRTLPNQPKKGVRQSHFFQNC